MARQLSEVQGCAHLDLDVLAWEPDVVPPQRRAFESSASDIRAFMHREPHWVIEGCYADLLAVALEQAGELVFLNPGVETCVANARNRPWEPHKYSSPAAQDKNLTMLVDWIRAYDQREDEFSYRAHRHLFDAFKGKKREFTSNARHD